MNKSEFPVSVWAWLPQHRRYQILDEAFDAVRRAHTPPPGESYVDASGIPYSTEADFADDLAFEFRERLLHLVGARAEPYLLGGIGGVAPDVSEAKQGLAPAKTSVAATVVDRYKGSSAP